MSYQVIVYQMLGADSFRSLVLTVVWGFVTVVAVVTCGFWMDTIGRKKALVSCRSTAYFIMEDKTRIANARSYRFYATAE